MLDYNKVVTELSSSIAEYQKKASGKDGAFYQNMVNELQTQYANLQGLNAQAATQQDLIVAWETLVECRQATKFKFYSDNKYTIAAASFLTGVIIVNIYRAVSKR